jgi:hypothetical protein
MGAGANAATEEMTVTKTRSFMMRWVAYVLVLVLLNLLDPAVLWSGLLLSLLLCTTQSKQTTLSLNLSMESQCLRCG